MSVECRIGEETGRYLTRCWLPLESVTLQGSILVSCYGRKINDVIGASPCVLSTIKYTTMRTPVHPEHHGAPTHTYKSTTRFSRCARSAYFLNFRHNKLKQPNSFLFNYVLHRHPNTFGKSGRGRPSTGRPRGRPRTLLPYLPDTCPRNHPPEGY